MAKKAKASGSPSAERNWTFMVYMAAEQSRDLDSVAVRDLREMERGCKDNDNIHVVVMLDRHWPGAQMYEVGGDGSTLVDQFSGKTNMGDVDTLKKFVTTVAESPDYRAKHYCLILWGHAFGLGFGRDHDDPLILSELKDALTEFKKARVYKRPKTDGRLEILGTNSCSMSYVEAAFELRENAELMIASQITVPFAGWPYDVIFKRIDDATPKKKLAHLIIDAYVSQFDDLPGGDRLAMTLLDLAHAEGLDEAVEALGKKIDEAIVSSEFSSDLLAQLRDLFMGAAAGDVRPLIDLTTLLLGLAEAEEPAFARIVPAATDLLKILHGDKKGPSESTKNKPKLVDHHKFSKDLDDLNGIGIYAPFVTDRGIIERLGLSEAPPKHGAPKLKSGQELYQALDIFPAGKKAAWPRLVYDGLRRTIPADLIVAIDGISELQTGDRVDVAQIIMSIESSLNQFDRAVEKAKAGIKEALKPASKSVKYIRSGAAAGSSRSFSAAWLRLITPVPLEALQQADQLKKLMAPLKGQAQMQAGATASSSAPTVSAIVAQLIRVESALAHVERVTRRGLIHARFGLGLLSPAPSGFGQEPPKSGDGQEPPKSGDGQEPPKSGDGQEPPKSGDGLPGSIPAAGDLRIDRGLQRVAGLFQEVGRAMQDLEQALADTEHVARESLVLSPAPGETLEAAAMQLRARFLVLEEASARARRTVRRALVHPIYGLGPSEGQLTFDVRQDLASRGGLDRLRLKLL